MTTLRPGSGPPSLLVILCCALVLGGCRTARHADPLGESFPEASITMAELDVRVAQLLNRMERAVRRSASVAYRQATTGEERIDAAVLSLRAADEMRRATYAGYPLATLIDVWVLNTQLQRHFERTPEVLGGQGLEMAGTSAEFSGECLEIATMVAGSEAADAMAADVQTWAEEHPIRDDLARPSVAPLLADLGVEPQRGLGDISETVSEGLMRLGEDIEILQTELPTTLSWQLAMLLEMRLAGIEDDLTGAMEALGSSLEPLVAAQVEVVLAAVREERIAIMQAVTNERIAIMADVTDERIAIMESVDEQRVALQDALEALRIASFRDLDRQRVELTGSMNALTDRGLEQVDVQRLATIEDLDAMVAQVLITVDTQRGLAVSDVDRIMESTVDHALDRVFRLMVTLGAGAFAGLFVLLILARLLWRRA